MKNYIVINQPQITHKDEIYTTISAKILIESELKDLWYRVPSKFSEYLMVENLDAFLVAMLPYGMEKGLNIKLNGVISSKLFYSLTHYAIPAISLAYPPFKKITIKAPTLSSINFNTGKVAVTGLSCGVDSFSTYFDHINDEKEFKVDYFNFFNVGSHGNWGEETRKLYLKRLERSQKFANEIGKSIITIDSNIHEILNMDFHPTNTLRNIACVLLFQKLIRNYYLASKNRIDFVKIPSYEAQDYDPIILHLFNTESTNFFSGVSQYNRIERTALIAKHPETFGHLDVCIKSRNVEGEKINCSKCNKCLRTALTLDLLGKLDLYSSVFDLRTYRLHKDDYIWYIITHKNKDQITKDIYNLLKIKKQINYPVILGHKIWNQKKKFQKLLRS